MFTTKTITPLIKPVTTKLPDEKELEPPTVALLPITWIISFIVFILLVLLVLLLYLRKTRNATKIDARPMHN